MKIRNGFVSNSSSSSFIVLFPKEITNYDELYELMWTDKNTLSIQKSYKFITDPKEKSNEYNSMNMTFDDFKKQATNYILNEILEQKKYNTVFFALSNLTNGWIDDDGYLNCADSYGHIFKNIQEIKDKITEYENIQVELENFDWNKSDGISYEDIEQKKYDMYWVENLKSTLEDIDEIIDENKNTFLYSFVFSDECGKFFSVLEHGGVFGDLTVFVESHH